MTKVILCSGKRKSAIAKATLYVSGKGRFRVNDIMLDVYTPEMYKLKIMEPLILAGEMVNSIDIDVEVEGGGMNSQAEAARLAISRCLVKSNKKLEKVFLKYNRQFLVADVRRKECAKPNRHGQARAKRQKSYR
jgi:small subunit ribosomal protein S9